MPVSKNKGTTSSPPASTPVSSQLGMTDQHTFHQYLHALTQSAVRSVIEAVIIEELDAFIGAAWGACSPKRKGYRNGFYTRDLATSTGRIDDLKVPRDREGQFHTRAFDRDTRYEPQIAEGLTQMFVAGTSTRHLWEKSLKPCWESLEVASAIGRLNQSLAQQFETWRKLRLPEHWRVLYLDGVHFSIRHGDKADATIILTALAVDLEGNKEVLARPCLCRGEHRGLGKSAARPPHPRSDPLRPHRDRWT